MEMMRIAICDDEEIHRQKLLTLLSFYKENEKIEVVYYSCGEDLISAYQSGERFFAIILDIELSGIDGFSTSTVIREYDEKVLICFLTKFGDYVYNVINVGVFGYLVKPVKESDFFALYRRIMKKFCEENATITLSYKKEVTVAKMRDIVYVEYIPRLKIKVVTANDILFNYGKLMDIKEKLDENFVEINKTIVINLKYVRSVNNYEITLTMNNIKISLPETRKREVVNRYIRHKENDSD